MFKLNKYQERQLLVELEIKKNCCP